MSSTSRLHPGANTAKMACPPQYEYFALLTAGSSVGGFPIGRDEDEEKPELGEKVHRSLLKEIEATAGAPGCRIQISAALTEIFQSWEIHIHGLPFQQDRLDSKAGKFFNNVIKLDPNLRWVRDVSN